MLTWFGFFSGQIEDLSQQATMAAAEKFKAPEAAGIEAPGAGPATIQEESDEEEVGVRVGFYLPSEGLPSIRRGAVVTQD